MNRRDLYRGIIKNKELLVGFLGMSLLIVLFVNVCNRSINRFDFVFVNLKKSYSKSELDSFRRYPVDSLYTYYDKFSDKLDAINIEKHVKNIHEVLIKKGKSKRFVSWREFLCVAFHYWVSNKNVCFDKVNEHFFMNLDNYAAERRREDNFRFLKLREMMIKNNDRIQVGDKIIITLPVRNLAPGVKSAEESRGYDYSKFIDSLVVYGEIIRKEYPTPEDSLLNFPINVWLTVNVHRKSNRSYRINNRLCDIGDSFLLDLYDYGRYLEKY